MTKIGYTVFQSYQTLVRLKIDYRKTSESYEISGSLLVIIILGQYGRYDDKQCTFISIIRHVIAFEDFKINFSILDGSLILPLDIIIFLTLGTSILTVWSIYGWKNGY
jgi:hypothetical protein